MARIVKKIIWNLFLIRRFEPHRLNKTFYRDDTDGKIVPNPAPLLSRTPGFAEGRPQPSVGEHTAEILREHGYTNEQINDLSSKGIIYGAEKSKL